MYTGGTTVAGPFDQHRVEQRDDVLVYTSAPFTEPTEVVGDVDLHLFFTTDVRDTDFVAKLCVVWPDGTSINLADGASRARYRNGYDRAELLEPGEVNEIKVGLGPTGYRFEPGMALRLQVTSQRLPAPRPQHEHRATRSATTPSASSPTRPCCTTPTTRRTWSSPCSRSRARWCSPRCRCRVNARSRRTAGESTMKRAVILLSSMLVCGLVLPSAAAQASGERFADEVFDEIVTTSDIVYGQATNYRGELETLRLDVHEPAGDDLERRPVYVWVHGGYFKRGHKAEAYHLAEAHKLTRAGYVTVSINYRLNPELPEGAGPAVTEARVDEYIDAVVDAQHDAQAAVRWVRANASIYRLDPERIAIGGHSAGAIIAAGVAFNSDDPGDSGNPGYSSRVAAAVSHAGREPACAPGADRRRRAADAVRPWRDRRRRALPGGGDAVRGDAGDAERVRAGAEAGTRPRDLRRRARP